MHYSDNSAYAGSSCWICCVAILTCYHMVLDGTKTFDISLDPGRVLDHKGSLVDLA